MSGGNAVPTCTYGRQTAYEIKQRFILAIPRIITSLETLSPFQKRDSPKERMVKEIYRKVKHRKKCSRLVGLSKVFSDDVTLNLRIRYYDISHVRPSYTQERQIRPGEVRGITVSSLARSEKFIVTLHEGVTYGLEVMVVVEGVCFMDTC